MGSNMNAQLLLTRASMSVAAFVRIMGSGMMKEEHNVLCRHLV
jgi:hypothetical protein